MTRIDDWEKPAQDPSLDERLWEALTAEQQDRMVVRHYWAVSYGKLEYAFYKALRKVSWILMDAKTLATKLLGEKTKEQLIAIILDDVAPSAPKVKPGPKPKAAKPATVATEATETAEAATETTTEETVEAEEVEDTSLSRVLDYVTGAPLPVTTRQVATDLSLKPLRAGEILKRFTSAGKIVRIGGGPNTAYTAPPPPAAT